LRRANVQLPPGFGKTLLALKALARLAKGGARPDQKPVRVALYVTPSLLLVDQIFSHLERFNPLQDVDHRAMIVASKTDTNVTNTTCPEEIASFLSSTSQEDKGSLRLLVSTYNSLPRVGMAMALLGERTDTGMINFGIFDEAHRMEGTRRLFGYGLDDALLPVWHRLFLTATPRNFVERDDGGLVTRNLGADSYATVNDNDPPRRELMRQKVRSMLDESLFGPNIVRRTQVESVKSGITVPLTLCAIDKTETRSILGYDLDEDAPREEWLPHMVWAAYEKLGVKRGVSFHRTNERAKAFKHAAESVFGYDIGVFRVHGKMSPKERGKVLVEAKTFPRSLIANCKLLSTGVDEREWDLCVVVDPVRSQVEARQRFGRVTRVAKGKSRGYVFVPLMFDAGGTDDVIGMMQGNGSCYTTLVAAFSAMVEGNPELRRGVDFVIKESERLGPPLHRDMYPEVLKDAFLLPPSIPLDVQNELVSRVVREVGAPRERWGVWFDLLLAFKKREGHCNVPQGHVECGDKLGIWLNSQRQLQRAGELGEMRRDRLEGVGMVWDVLDAQWDEAFSALLRYQQRFGHANVPQGHREGGINLGVWLNNQRNLQRAGKLSKERFYRLEEVDIAWNVLDAQWERQFIALEMFRQLEGHVSVPREHEDLCIWLDRQRQLQKSGELSQERKQRLEEVGVVWNVFVDEWEKSWVQLKHFAKREGHCNVPYGHVEYGKKLGMWLSKQRKLLKAGELGEDRRWRLEEVGVAWNVLDEQWDKKFVQLKCFVEREGHCNVPLGHIECGEKIGYWLNNQRTLQKVDKLGEERRRQLGGVGVAWNVLDAQWEENFEKGLLRFCKREKHANVPVGHVEGTIKLGTWLMNQRHRKHTGKLETSRKERLEAAGVVWDVLDAQWGAKFCALKRFIARVGHANVPQGHVEGDLKLGIWLSDQRHRKKLGKLNGDRKQRLEEIGVVWKARDLQHEKS